MASVCVSLSPFLHKTIFNTHAFLSFFFFWICPAQSQRDDLESLAYFLSFLRHGSLPWFPLQLTQASQSPDPNPVKPQLWRIKMATPASVLFREMDPSYIEFWRDLKSLAFGEVPDYAAMKRRFVECWIKSGFGEYPGELDWWAIYDQAQNMNHI